MLKSIRRLLLLCLLFQAGKYTRMILAPETLVMFVNRVFDYRIQDRALLRHGSGCVWKKNVSFEEKIASIACKTTPFTDPRNLFQSKDFAIMYRYPKSYLPYVHAFLADNSCLLEQKEIVLYAMEQLPFADYRTLAAHCIRLYNKGQIPDSLLITALGYSLAGDHPMVKNHKSQSVQELWAEIVCPTDKLAEHIQHISNGNLLKECLDEQSAHPFRWEKKPLPFKDTVKQIAKEGLLGLSFQTEGLLGSDAFMMLYEHARDYYSNAIMDVGTLSFEEMCAFLEQELREKSFPLTTCRYIAINAMRKLEEQQFIDLLIKLEQSEFGPMTLENWSCCTLLRYSRYDTLALKPYPVSTDLTQYAHLPNDMQDVLKYYVQTCLLERNYQQRLYGIPAYDEKKPFYLFDSAPTDGSNV